MAVTEPASDLSDPPVTTSSHTLTRIRTTRVLLGCICFIAGAAVMVIEISANRLLAPSFGNSIYTWTALIGVILIAFSVGGYVGGTLADKLGRVDLLGWLLAGAATLTVLIPALNTFFVHSLANAGPISGPIIISLLLFTLPGILLGAVSPAAVRFYSLMGHDKRVGNAAGLVSMLGSLGSFAGTFLTGFVFLSAFGLKVIFLGAGAVLCVTSFLAFWLAKTPAKKTAATFVTLLLSALIGGLTVPKTDPTIVFKQLSFYHQIEVQDLPRDGDIYRHLMLDSSAEGAMTVPKGYLLMPYQRYWQLALLNTDLKLQRVLFIGGGAFGMPEHAATLGADVQVDVVEIDPAVIAVGRRFFKLDEFPNVHAYSGDARRFLRTTSQKYELIFGDAYNGVRHVPAHLVTQEFFEEVRSKLTDKGVFLINIITGVEGECAVLLSHILATLRAVFPSVEVFAVSKEWREPHNVILLGSMSSWKPWLEGKPYAPDSWKTLLVNSRVPSSLLPDPRAVFTDDRNPIDSVIAKQLLK